VAATVSEALGAATDALAAAGIETPRIDAEVLLEAATGRGRAELIADRSATIDPAAARTFSESVRRRLRLEPVAHITGRKGFRHIELEVDQRVLIPRPETEMLVELALEVRPQTVLEIGTGSGAIALAICDELPGCRVEATDTSADALAVAASNAARLGLTDRLGLTLGTWPEPAAAPPPGDLPDFPRRFDLIVTNLPYVAEGGPVSPEVARWEPAEALFAGPEGLDSFREVLGGLAGSGCEAPVIALEIGFDQAEAVSGLLAAAGYGRTEVRRDLAGHDRVVVGSL
jgi:release factor glutamine methyltransferase